MSVESDDAESSSGASPRNASRTSRPSTVSKSASQKTKATHTIDRTPEYEDFIATLRVYHKNRGTSFEPEPWVGSAHLDLLKVFKHVVAAGGYDQVSATTLEWRKLATELGLDVTDRSAAGVAYALKSAFLKYLAAYEILTIHKKEPPPPQILEHESAKGGGLLTRTLENYTPKKGPATTVARAASVNASASETDDTPARKETPRSGGTSRNLRVAPPQRVIFQPDTGTSRQTRPAAPSSQQSNHSHSATGTPTPQAKPPSLPQGHSHPSMGMPQPVHAPHMPQTIRGPSINYAPQNPEVMSTLVQNFEPRLDMVPIPMRVVETPANNPAEFERRRRQDRLKASGAFSQPQSIRPPPGATVFEGPNIYVRCLCALRSGIPSEQAYALHHLVKISYERGDKFKFENFAGLAEGLVGKGLEVGSKFFHVNWTIDYSGDPDESNLEELDGLNGTPDVLERIAQLQPKDVIDAIQPADFADDMVQITEAVLTMRNMVTLPENAVQMAEFPVLRDLICIILHLPNNESVVELKHCALDIAEQLTPYIVLEAEDPLYRTLIAQLHSTDRGAILTALRATTRLSMYLGETNRLPDVPADILQNILDWLMLNDDELIDACLDFLYVYTAFIANIEPLMKAVRAPHLVNHLVRLLSHGARRVQKDYAIEPERKLPACETPLPIPEDLREELLQMGEPDRCFAWLKCLFEEDPDSAITQIAIWQAYQASFSMHLQQLSRPMINAAEFIKNVPHVFKEAEPQIVKEMTERGESAKFIIRGVRPRTHPTTTDGREYVPCLWKTPVPPGNGQPGQRAECSRHFKTAEQLYKHIIMDHVGEKPTADGKFSNKERDLYCTWGNCARFPRLQKLQLSSFMNHIKTHSKAAQQKMALAHASSVEASISSKRPRRTYIVPPQTISIHYEETAFLRDERAPPVAAGIPFSAVLVLRNVARNVSKAEGLVLDLPELAAKGQGQSASPLEHLFRPVTARLCDIMAKNQLLAGYVQQVLDIARDNY